MAVFITYPILLIPFSLVFFPFQRKIFKNFAIWQGLTVLTLTLSYIYYSVLFLSPDVFNIGYKNDVFSYKVSDIFSWQILFHLFSNIQTFVRWIISYLTLPFVFLVLLSLRNRTFIKEKLYLLICFLVPFLIFAVLGKLTYPRYLFSITLPLILLGAECIASYYSKPQNRIYSYIFSFVLIIIFSFYNYKILFDFPRSPLPEEELFQYANGWPSGYGMKEIIKYLDNESSKISIYVTTDGNYNSPTGGLATMMLETYFMKNPKIENHVVFPVPKKVPKELVEIAKAKPVYVIFNQTQVMPPWPMDLILEFRKGIGNYYVRLYRIRAS